MWFLGWKGPSGFSARSTAEDVTQGVDGTGLTAIITGASSGLGAETTRVLALRGVRVVMAVRNVNAGKVVKEAILREAPAAEIDITALDVSSLGSVRKFASEYISSGRPLSILINNAGIMATPFKLSEDGIEMQFATNYLGHFVLTNLLLETLKKTACESKKEGRIVNVSSLAHKVTYPSGISFDTINNESKYSSLNAYGQSKLANILHAKELTRHFKEEGVNITANSLHPGVIFTNLLRHHPYITAMFNMCIKYLTRSIPQGAATTCFVALNPQVKGVSGEYFSDSNIADPSPLAKDIELAKKLWDFSINLANSK